MCSVSHSDSDYDSILLFEALITNILVNNEKPNKQTRNVRMFFYPSQCVVISWRVSVSDEQNDLIFRLNAVNQLVR